LTGLIGINLIQSIDILNTAALDYIWQILSEPGICHLEKIFPKLRSPRRENKFFFNKSCP